MLVLIVRVVSLDIWSPKSERRFIKHCSSFARPHPFREDLIVLSLFLSAIVPVVSLFSRPISLWGTHTNIPVFSFFFFFLYIFRILSLMECCLSSACLIKRPGLLLARFIAAIRQNDETAPRDAIPTIRKVSHTEPFYLLVDIYKAHKRPNDRPGRFNHHQEVRGSPTIAWWWAAVYFSFLVYICTSTD